MAGLAVALLAIGCGNLTDKDRIVIAKFEGEDIRRGDLYKLIREMDDERRPIIRNRGDLLRVLNRHIDDTVLDELVRELKKAGAITVSRTRAQQVYFDKVPDDLTIYRVRSADELEELEVTEGQLTAWKAAIEFRIDDVEKELERDAALNQRAQEAFTQNLYPISEEEYRREFEFQKNRLFFYERIGFVGLRFMSDFPTSNEEVARARRQYDEGKPFREILQFYHSLEPDLIQQSMIENNPNLGRFKSFWTYATGAKVGDVIGPVFLPEYTVATQNEDGTIERTPYAKAYLLFEVTEYIPRRQKTWEEARPELATTILRRKVMERLRAEHGAEIFEDRIPDPARYNTESESGFVDAG